MFKTPRGHRVAKNRETVGDLFLQIIASVTSSGTITERMPANIKGCARETPHKFKAQSARRNVISPLSSFHRLDGLVSFTSQVANALAFISRSVSA
jgi:uncharacterized protein (DUF2342 family)